MLKELAYITKRKYIYFLLIIIFMLIAISLNLFFDNSVLRDRKIVENNIIPQYNSYEELVQQHNSFKENLSIDAMSDDERLKENLYTYLLDNYLPFNKYYVYPDNIMSFYDSSFSLFGLLSIIMVVGLIVYSVILSSLCLSEHFSNGSFIYLFSTGKSNFKIILHKYISISLIIYAVTTLFYLIICFLGLSFFNKEINLLMVTTDNIMIVKYGIFTLINYASTIFALFFFITMVYSIALNIKNSIISLVASLLFFGSIIYTNSSLSYNNFFSNLLSCLIYGPIGLYYNMHDTKFLGYICLIMFLLPILLFVLSYYIFKKRSLS